ncbi:MAG: DUF2635 domain-containing protein [Janthinobacterium lividum]
MFVKPSPGIRMPDPDMQDFLPEGGREVPDTAYWLRRELDGDVVRVEQAGAAPVTEEPASNRSIPE